MRPKLTKYIVFNYFSGDSTALQKKMIEEWLSDTENVEIYFEWLEEWERLEPQFIPDTVMALNNITDEIFNETTLATEEIPLPASKTYRKLFSLMAASILLVLGITLYLGRNFVIYHTYQTAFGELKTINLEDGSQVILNANSSLKVPRWGFGTSTRHVYLEGEASFSVKHTPDHRHFQVHNPDHSLITVLGTEFMVYTRKQATKVVLNTGKVRLTSFTKDTPLTMNPGDQATVENNGKIRLEHLTQDKLEDQLAWKEHRFVFDDTPLKDVAAKIQEVFGVVVRIEDKNLAMRTATGSFPAKNAGELLTSMAYMYSFEISKTDSRITLIPTP